MTANPLGYSERNAVIHVVAPHHRRRLACWRPAAIAAASVGVRAENIGPDSATISRAFTRAEQLQRCGDGLVRVSTPPFGGGEEGRESQRADFTNQSPQRIRLFKGLAGARSATCSTNSPPSAPRRTRRATILVKASPTHSPPQSDGLIQDLLGRSFRCQSRNQSNPCKGQTWFARTRSHRNRMVRSPLRRLEPLG